jgi:hypothetical protein
LTCGGRGKRASCHSGDHYAATEGGGGWGEPV